MAKIFIVLFSLLLLVAGLFALAINREMMITEEKVKMSTVVDTGSMGKNTGATVDDDMSTIFFNR